MSEPRKLAVFDFDGTLIKGDSLWPFLTAVAGTPQAAMAAAEGFVGYYLRLYNNRFDPTLQDMRTYVKAHMLRKLLGGRKAGTFGPAIEKVRRWVKWNESVRKSMLDHFAKGSHQIVIASGALDLYLPELLKDFPPHELLCTVMIVKNGTITGEMAGDNCVRQWKAQRLSEYLAGQEPFDDSWGYGNMPHDNQMLNMKRSKHQIIISWRSIAFNKTNLSFPRKGMN